MIQRVIIIVKDFGDDHKHVKVNHVVLFPINSKIFVKYHNPLHQDFNKLVVIPF